MQNSTRSQVDPFIVMDVMERARIAESSGRRIIHMEVGQPGTGAPEGARRALASAMKKAPLGYTVALGVPELRNRISRHYRERHNLEISPERIVVTSGSSGAFILAFTALFNPGDRVCIGSPGYPSYRQILKALDLVAVDIQTIGENRFQLVPDDIIGIELAGLMVASPANPTGTMLDAESLRALMSAADASGISFISDEIYHGIEYGGRAVSALEISDDCYVINSFSKYFSMTGWRAGWMVVPEKHVRMIERLAQNLFICPPHASQIVALAAMDCHDELEANVDVYRKNRKLMLNGLPMAGFDRIAPPDGAFYIYADVGHLTQDSRLFAEKILDSAGVAVTPGLDFDAKRGHRTLRFSYASGTEDIEEGLERLKSFMETQI
ncbi:MAG: aminotransferase class I/II-fold pyridoxal phosphate-dependent enzyme [Roseovarius sp.]|nr:aminotransferase class I/II-fold pyridoxal phosphate-dependent enzyme [Roseovarius sp.]